MKESYETIELEVICFEAADVITTSVTDDETEMGG